MPNFVCEISSSRVPKRFYFLACLFLERLIGPSALAGLQSINGVLPHKGSPGGCGVCELKPAAYAPWRH